MAVVREAEAVQEWNANVGALILHPRIRSHLRTQLFIHYARVLGFGKLVWHGITKDELLIEAGRSYLDRYTYIEAASNPLILCIVDDICTEVHFKSLCRPLLGGLMGGGCLKVGRATG